MEKTFHAPADLADALIREGLAVAYDPPTIDVGGSTMLSLGDAATAIVVVLGTSADLVALTGIRAPMELLAARIASWRATLADSRRYGLFASGPKGQIRLELDNRPDPRVIAKLLEAVYGGEDHHR